MQQSFKATLRSTAPFLMNNGRLANPMDTFARAIKKITAKRHKTEADFEELAKLEWHGSLYLKNGKPCLPALMLDACLINGAKKVKKGMQAKAGLFSIDDFVLHHDGPETIAALWETERFRFTIGCRLQGKATIMRTRPRFDTWSADIEIAFNDEALNASDIREFLLIAGRDVGIGNWRPRFGRFEMIT